MSVWICCECAHLVDTDSDPDSLYVVDYEDLCVCVSCRDRLDLEVKD